MGVIPARIAAVIAGLAVAVAAIPVAGAWERPSAENPDAVAYAGIHEVSVPEAESILNLQAEAGRLEVELSEVGAEWFAGLWIEHEPTFHVVVLSVAPDAADLWAVVRQSPLARLTEVRPAARTLGQLTADLDRLRSHAVDGRFRVHLDVPANGLVVETPSPLAVMEYLATNGIDMPTYAAIREDRRYVVPTANVYAGKTLRANGNLECTSG